MLSQEVLILIIMILIFFLFYIYKKNCDEEYYQKLLAFTQQNCQNYNNMNYEYFNRNNFLYNKSSDFGGEFYYRSNPIKKYKNISQYKENRNNNYYTPNYNQNNTKKYNFGRSLEKEFNKVENEKTLFSKISSDNCNNNNFYNNNYFMNYKINENNNKIHLKLTDFLDK